jgi:hypothetical protein
MSSGKGTGAAILPLLNGLASNPLQKLTFVGEHAHEDEFANKLPKDTDGTGELVTSRQIGGQQWRYAGPARLHEGWRCDLPEQCRHQIGSTQPALASLGQATRRDQIIGRDDVNFYRQVLKQLPIKNMIRFKN